MTGRIQVVFFGIKINLIFFNVYNSKLWDVKSANESKSINVKQFFLNSEEPQEDIEVIVKCCSWFADGAKIMVAAKNKIFVSISILFYFYFWLLGPIWWCSEFTFCSALRDHC